MFPPHRQGPLDGQFQSALPEGDTAIRQTDSDAILARYSAVQKGYLSDPFVRPLLPRGGHLQHPRPPLINIGTYVRSEAIDKLVDQWLDLASAEGKQSQIVSLGAGSDTRFWRIASSPRARQLAKYVEIDFAENTSRKAMAIRKSKDLGSLLGKAEDVKIVNGGTGLHSPVYHLLPADLRLPPSEAMKVLTESSASGADVVLSPDLPTLLVFECVLVYMTPDASYALVQWFTDYFVSSDAVLGAVVYEMFGLDDAFGKVMLNNLKARNVTLPGAEPYPNVESLPTRFEKHGFTISQARTLRDIRRSFIGSDELERISDLELLDEIEELELVLEHYAITWGFKLYGKANATHWSTWGLKAEE
ncbi:leucine carboxyl methyltransferase [Irpex rosettiformis]|uniref:Leucine carboxyl methyltransferase n=1 Tax=Irpex rosettiformis TaxID=378272 RepID=A0ACB8U8T7_9APHY|nr:leucine carboxyl methyltransferase [Irpex rosettiformis]